ncbi:MAG: helicase-related protein, partial [Hyphococcus sp.]
DIVAKSLQKHGFNARPIHGDLAQAFRTETLDKFRNDEVQFLVASDVAARGLDIPAVSHVFNYDVPIHADDYVHRIGRTGRAGREGAAMMLVTPADGKYYDAILKTIGVDDIEALDFSGFFGDLETSGAKRRPKTERRRENTSRSRAKDKSADDAEPAETSTANRRKRSDSKPARRRETKNEKIVGLGDHVPAFLTRAVC